MSARDCLKQDIDRLPDDKVEAVQDYVSAILFADVNGLGVAFPVFLREIAAQGWPVDDPDMWRGQWREGYTSQEAIAEQATD